MWLPTCDESTGGGGPGTVQDIYASTSGCKVMNSRSIVNLVFPKSVDG